MTLQRHRKTIPLPNQTIPHHMKQSLTPHQSQRGDSTTPHGSSPSAQAFTRIRAILQQARGQALMAVNAAMVKAYWEVGREIVEEEQSGQERAGYGQGLLAELADKLTAEFGRGFTATNLRYMRQFYLAFPIHHTLRDELSWSHYRLLSRIEKLEVRAFYEVEAVQSRWSTRELERQIASLLYERLALSRDKAGVRALAEHGAQAFEPTHLVRDPYVLEFTGLPEQGSWLESDLEQALIDHLQNFLLELGRDFFFVARQKRLTLDGDHFYIDLVF